MMSQLTGPKFVHRYYPDGTYESICTECISMAGCNEDDREPSCNESLESLTRKTETSRVTPAAAL